MSYFPASPTSTSTRSPTTPSMTCPPTMPTPPTTPPSGLALQAADGTVFQVPPRLVRYLPAIDDDASIVLPVSTDSLRFALSTLSAYPALLPVLDDSFLQDLITLAEHGVSVPLRYVAGKLKDRDPMRGFVLQVVDTVIQKHTQDSASTTIVPDTETPPVSDAELDTPPCSAPTTPCLKSPELSPLLGTFFGNYEGDRADLDLDLDPWLSTTLTRYAPTAAPQLKQYLAGLEGGPEHKLTLGWDGEDGEGFGFGYGYGSRDGFGYGGRSGYGSGNGPYGSGLAHGGGPGGIGAKIERTDGAGYETRYHCARW